MFVEVASYFLEKIILENRKISPQGVCYLVTRVERYTHSSRPLRPAFVRLLPCQFRIEETPLTRCPISKALTRSCPRYAPRLELGKACEVFLALSGQARRKGELSTLPHVFFPRNLFFFFLNVEELLALYNNGRFLPLPFVAELREQRCEGSLTYVPLWCFVDGGGVHC